MGGAAPTYGPHTRLPDAAFATSRTSLSCASESSADSLTSPGAAAAAATAPEVMMTDDEAYDFQHANGYRYYPNAVYSTDTAAGIGHHHNGGHHSTLPHHRTPPALKMENLSDGGGANSTGGGMPGSGSFSSTQHHHHHFPAGGGATSCARDLAGDHHLGGHGHYGGMSTMGGASSSGWGLSHPAAGPGGGYPRFAAVDTSHGHYPTF